MYIFIRDERYQPSRLRNICLFISSYTFAQTDQKINLTDTTFKVFGACEQCKDRIEGALKLKGINKAIWDVDAKLLSIQFDAKKISLDKIENKVVAVGHDTENKKSKKAVYDALPACCHYREIDALLEEEKKDFYDTLETKEEAISFETFNDFSYLDVYFSFLEHLDSVKSGEKIRKIIEDFEPKYIDFSIIPNKIECQRINNNAHPYVFGCLHMYYLLTIN